MIATAPYIVYGLATRNNYMRHAGSDHHSLPPPLPSDIGPFLVPQWNLSGRVGIDKGIMKTMTCFHTGLKEQTKIHNMTRTPRKVSLDLFYSLLRPKLVPKEKHDMTLNRWKARLLGWLPFRLLRSA